MPDGAPQATLLLVWRAARRVVEPYGGMTDGRRRLAGQLPAQVGGDPLLARARPPTYDLWGLAHPGIDQFKAGFGGQEVTWIGAWETGHAAVVRGVVNAAQRARVAVATRRLGRPPAGGDAG